MRRERERFVAYLRSQGMRVTATRLRLLDEILEHHDHIDAEALLEAMRSKGLGISRATVYRNLDLLAGCGLVRKQRLGRHRYLYEHVHTGLRHDYLVCRECGRVVEFLSPGIAALHSEICRTHGFQPTEYTLQITGLCRDCAGREEGGDPGPS
jgi:Fur family ferric uptake transcriptional regulator